MEPRLKIREKLKIEYDYDDNTLTVLIDDLMRCNQRILSAFLKWCDTGDLPGLKVKGYTIQNLIEKHQMHIPAAFLTLNWLIKDPEKARAALKRGKDRIVG